MDLKLINKFFALGIFIAGLHMFAIGSSDCSDTPNKECVNTCKNRNGVQSCIKTWTGNNECKCNDNGITTFPAD